MAHKAQRKSTAALVGIADKLYPNWRQTLAEVA